MSKSYVLITPYSLGKGRAGAIMSRLLSRVDLELAGARIYAPDAKFVEQYAETLEKSRKCACISSYIRTAFAPLNGQSRRLMLLVLEGDNAVKQVAETVGKIPSAEVVGASTIRDTYAEMAVDQNGKIIHAEPGVIIPDSDSQAEEELALFSALSERTPNITSNTVGTLDGMEKSLVIIKPESWRSPSVAPGAIIDIFTRTRLKLAGCKMHRISVTDALEFYGPVKFALREKLAPKKAEKAKAMLEERFGVKITSDLTESVGYACTDAEFHKIVEFMSGVDPVTCPECEKDAPGKARCMVLVFEGFDPVTKIRTVLGSTDSSKALPGTVRGEFGTDIMVNAAHASDSIESFKREGRILRIDENNI